jgi:hypothetical protein
MAAPFLARQEAADLLGKLGLPTSVATLETWVTRPGGPPYAKWGRRCVYPRSELIAWAVKRLGQLQHNSSVQCSTQHKTSLAELMAIAEDF